MKRLFIAGIMALAMIPALGALGQQVTYTGSFQAASGDYIFTERTSSVYFFNSLNVSTERFRAGVSIPLIYQSSPWISYSVVGGLPSGGTEQGTVNAWRKGKGQGDGQGSNRVNTVLMPDTTTYDQLGLGDPSLQAALEVVKENGLIPAVRVRGDVKLPLADVDRGFGTGAWDFGSGLSLSKSLGTTFLFVDVMQWWLGDLSELELKDPVSYSVALGHSMKQGKLGLMAALAGYSEVIMDVDPPLQVSIGASYWLKPGRGVSASVAAGLSESSPDYSISFGWSIIL